MKILEWFKNLWAKIPSVIKSFLAEIFNQSLAIVIANLKEFALETVQELAVTDLSNPQKRKEAFDKIKEYAKKEGIEVKDSVINLVIELCVQKIKNV